VPAKDMKEKDTKRLEKFAAQLTKLRNGYYGQSLPAFHCKVYHSFLSVVADVI
jgi:hypothetical protein